MAEATEFSFTYKEIVEALVKKQGLHEGIWMLNVEMGLQGANVGPDDNRLVPAALVPLVKMGIKRADKLTSLSVDAAVVNPRE